MERTTRTRSERERMFSVWSGMFSRCYNEKAGNYKYYGGRGITVCDHWRSFQHFFDDMQPRPPGHSIDRIDPNGPYCKENCRWATRKDQLRNTRRAHMLTHDGKTLSVCEWSEITGLMRRTILARIKRGWDVSRALTEPLAKIYDHKKYPLSGTGKTWAERRDARKAKKQASRF